MEFTEMQNALIAQLTSNGESVAKDLAAQLNLPKAEVAKALGELFKGGTIERELRDKKLFYKMAIEVGATAPAATEEVVVTEQGETTATTEELVDTNPAPATEETAAPAKEEGAKVVAMGETKAKPAEVKPEATKKTTKATATKGKKKVVKAGEADAKPAKAPKPPTAASLIAKIKKAKTEEAVKAIAGEDKRTSVIAAGVKQIAKLTAPPKAPKVKKAKAKGDKVKVAPAKEFINEDGTLKYDKLSKPKRGDLVEFEAWGENPAAKGIVLFPDWDFWQGKIYIKVLGANGKAGWKSVSKVTKVLAKAAAKTFISGNKLKEAFDKAKEPAWRDWKVELCKKALAAK